MSEQNKKLNKRLTQITLKHRSNIVNSYFK